jgi:hypothetical protein
MVGVSVSVGVGESVGLGSGVWLEIKVGVLLCSISGSRAVSLSDGLQADTRKIKIENMAGIDTKRLIFSSSREGVV